MFNTLLRMWKKGKITREKVYEAVEKGWITKEQADYIVAQPQDL